jgi:hypothetical protein
LQSKGQDWIQSVSAPSQRAETWLSAQDLIDVWCTVEKDAVAHWHTFVSYILPADKKRSLDITECKVIVYLAALMHRVALLPSEFCEIMQWEYTTKDFDEAWRTVYGKIRKWWYETHTLEPLFDIVTLGTRYLDRILHRYEGGMFTNDGVPTKEDSEQLRQACTKYLALLTHEGRYLQTKQMKEAKQTKKKSHRNKKNSSSSRYILRDWLILTFLCIQWAQMYDLSFTLPWLDMLTYVGLKANILSQETKPFSDLVRGSKQTVIWQKMQKNL